ncbi:MAG TPA: DMT family transporter [Streptosporangiaceae bacterium]
MNADRRRAIAALTTAGLAWGTTVPLSKLALGWLQPGWLTFTRFGLAAAILLLAAPRSGVRAACTPAVLASGAAGYGGSVVLQNAGITHTSVTHAALLIGATPVLVAVIAAAWHHTVARPVAWAGFAVSLAGVGLVAGGPAGDAAVGGDGLVLAALLLSATFTVAQTRLLRGRDPIGVTAVQFLGAALAVLPFSAATEGMPAASRSLAAVLATAALAAGGTMLPFTLFAYGQSRVSAEVAGAFVNLEPLVGAAAGIIVFGDPVGLAQVSGGAAIIAGIALSTLPLLAGGRRRQLLAQPRQHTGHPSAPADTRALAAPRKTGPLPRSTPSATRQTRPARSREQRALIAASRRCHRAAAATPTRPSRACDGSACPGLCRGNGSSAGVGGHDAKSGVADLADSLRPLGSSHSSCRPRANGSGVGGSGCCSSPRRGR